MACTVVSSSSHVLYTTSNLVNSRRCQDKDGKEMYQNVKLTCMGVQNPYFCSLSPLFCAGVVLA